MRVLTLDCGTSRLKAGVFQIVDLGAARPSAVRAPMRLWIEKVGENSGEELVPGRDHSHLEVESYLARVFELLRRVSGELAGEGLQVDALCPSVCCPALVALDRNLRPLYPAITHLHRGSQPHARELADRLGTERWLSKTGNLPVPGGISITALRWLAARQPHVVSHAAHWVHLHALLLHTLTGRLVTDPTQAAYTGLYDVPGGSGWLDDDWLNELGVRREQLPEVAPSASIAGKLTAGAAQASGLPRGLPVVTGGADIPIGLLAAEELLPDCALNMSGTTEVFAASSEGCPQPAENYLLRPHLVPGRWVTVKVIPVGGQSLIWFRDRFCREMSTGRFWDWLTRLDVKMENFMEEQRMGSGPGVPEFIPYLFGNRHSLEPLTGGFLNLTAENSREDMLCAVLAAYRRSLREASREISAAVGRPLYRVVTSGGFDISSLGFHRRAALDRSTLTPLEAAVVRGAAVLTAMALEQG